MNFPITYTIIVILGFVIVSLLYLCFQKVNKEHFDTSDEAIQTISSLIEKNFIFSGGMIVMWSGPVANIPSGWALCDGNNGTPNLSGRFIVASGGNYSPAQTGGTNSQTINISVGNLPPHSHSFGYNDWYFSESNCGNQGWLGSGDSDRDNGPCGQDRRGNTDNTGGGQPITFDNRPAFYALAFIMKLP